MKSARTLCSIAMLLTALSLVAPAQAQQVDARVAAFRAVCETPTSFGDYSVAARDGGWRPVAADADPQLAALSRFTRQAMTNIRIDAYERDIGGARVFLFLTRLPVRQRSVDGCGLYDFAAAEAVDQQAFASWLSGEQVTTARGGGVIHEWRRPANLPRVFAVKLSFVAAGGAMANAVGYAGVAMTLERVGLANP
jgi:hypothetical protein